MKTQPLSFVSVRLVLGVRRSLRRVRDAFSGGRATDVPAGTRSDIRAIRLTCCPLLSGVWICCATSPAWAALLTACGRRLRSQHGRLSRSRRVDVAGEPVSTLAGFADREARSRTSTFGDRGSSQPARRQSG